MFSRSGDNLFFCTNPKEKKTVRWDSIVEVWNSKDIYENLNLKFRNDLINYPQYHSWNFKQGTYANITDEEWPDSFFNGDQTTAFLFNSKAYHPKVKWINDIDLKLIDLKSGKTLKQITQLENKSSNIEVSPQGNYFHYFKNLQWYLVNIRSGREINLSELFEHPLYDIHYSYSGSPPAYGIPGYSSDEREIIVYDAYDIWTVDLKTLKKRRLTRGREENRSYRVIQTADENSSVPNHGPFTASVLDLKKSLYLSAKDGTYNSGFYFLKNGKLQKIAYKFAYLHSPKIAGKSLLYMEESQGLPPRLMYWSENLKEPRAVFQSNPQHFRYDWGKAELISYSNGKEDDKPVFGALFYPFNYDPQKKYPLIVKVYEDLAMYINRYSRPSFKVSEGINISLLRSQGYFVLFPNLRYKQNDIGVSANASLNRILDKVLENRSINEKRMGLTGYSFGGYETNYIVTHNDRFAAAASGGSFADLIRRYTIPDGFGQNIFFQFENYQSRMSGPYYKLKEVYLRNSPIMDVENANTPLLLFAGKKDYHVDWHESVAFYSALKRAGKETVLLLYPEEAHVFFDPKKREDLTHRIMEWFDHYLKGSTKSNWMKANSYDYD